MPDAGSCSGRKSRAHQGNVGMSLAPNCRAVAAFRDLLLLLLLFPWLHCCLAGSNANSIMQGARYACLPGCCQSHQITKSSVLSRCSTTASVRHAWRWQLSLDQAYQRQAAPQPQPVPHAPQQNAAWMLQTSGGLACATSIWVRNPQIPKALDPYILLVVVYLKVHGTY